MRRVAPDYEYAIKSVRLCYRHGLGLFHVATMHDSMPGRMHVGQTLGFYDSRPI
jgi:hypothetical protein